MNNVDVHFKEQIEEKTGENFVCMFLEAKGPDTDRGIIGKVVCSNGTIPNFPEDLIYSKSIGNIPIFYRA
jgi:hypothetical protein